MKSEVINSKFNFAKNWYKKGSKKTAQNGTNISKFNFAKNWHKKGSKKTAKNAINIPKFNFAINSLL